MTTETKYTLDYIQYAENPGELRAVKVAYTVGNEWKTREKEFESLSAFYAWINAAHHSYTVAWLKIATTLTA